MLQSYYMVTKMKQIYLNRNNQSRSSRLYLNFHIDDWMKVCYGNKR